MRVVVTGGAGLIGSHLCERLLADGHAVSCVDNFYSGAERNIAGLAGLEVVRHDVTEPLPAAPADRIYHLACPASPVFYRRDPVYTTRTAVLGTLHALELARATGARLLLASTSEVYGDPEVHPQPEAYRGRVDPTGPRACYDEGKRVAETLCFDYARQYGTAVKVARIFNTYGPRMQPDDGRVVPAFVLAALAGAPLPLHGDGGQTRSFCYVTDLVDGLVRLMESPAAFTGPVNLGNPEETTIRALADRIRAATGSKSGIAYEPRPVDDPARRCPDIALATAELAWSPRVGLDAGLAATIEDLARYNRSVK